MKSVIIQGFIMLLLFSNCNETNIQQLIDETENKSDTFRITNKNILTEEDYDDLTDYSNCKYDTNTCAFTCKAMIRFDHRLNYTYSNRFKKAGAVLGNGDSIWVHIGGCNKFYYTAELISSIIPFESTTALTHKARWMAMSFFEGSGFDDKYKECIEKGYYEEIKSVENGSNIKQFKINDPDTLQNIMVFDGFTFENKGDRVKISIGGYKN